MSLDITKHVHVRLYAAARAAVGTREMHVAPARAGEILALIAAENTQTAQVFSRCSILLDGELLHDLTSFVEAGRVMDVLPPFAGGAY